MNTHLSSGLRALLFSFGLTFGLSLGALSQAADAPKAALGAAELGNGLQFHLPRLSPDGTRTAVVGSARGLQSVLVRDNASGSMRPLHRLESPELQVVGLEWLDEQRLLLRMEVGGDDSQLLSIAHQALLVLDVRDGNALNLYRGLGDRVVWGNRRAQLVPQPVLQPDQLLLHAVGGDGVSVVRISTTDARRKIVMRPMKNVSYYWADSQGAVRAALRQSDGHTELLLRPPGQREWDSRRRWQDSAADAWWLLGFDADPRYVIVRAGHEGKPALLRIDTERMDTEPQLLHQAPALAGAMQLLRRSSDGAVVGVQTPVGRTYFGDRLDELMNGLAAALPGPSLDLLQWQGERYLLRSSAAHEPPRYWLGSRSAGKLDPLLSQFPELPPELPLRSLQAGTAELPVTLYRPADDSRRPVLWCEPCALSRTDRQSAFNPLVAFLVNRGWAVLVPRPRSGAVPGENIVQGSDRRIARARAALDAALSKDSLGLDAKRQALMASNLSAYDAMRWASQQPTRFEALVALDALSSLKRYASLDTDPFGASTRASVRRALAGLDNAAIDAASPAQSADRLPARLLLVHATHSSSVSIGHAEDLVDARRALNLPVDLLRLDRSTDDIAHGPLRQQVLEAVERTLGNAKGG